MCKNFHYFQTREIQISHYLKQGDAESASRLIEEYVQERLQYFASRQGGFYRKLLSQTGSNIKSATTGSSCGRSVSRQTAAKLYGRQNLPSFQSLSKLVAERDRDVVVIFDPFEGTDKKKVWVRFSGNESTAYAISSLLRGVLRSESGGTDRASIAKLAGLSENTIRLAEKRQGHPLYDESIVCHSVETACRIAAANQYRMSILFFRTRSNEDRASS